AVRLRSDQLARGAIERIAEAVTIEVGQQLLAALVEEHVLVDAIIVPCIVRRHLVHPAHFTRLRILSPERHRPLVVARTLIGVPRARISGAMVEEVEGGIVGIPTPRGAAAAPPFVTLPRRNAEVLPLRGRIRRLEGVLRDPDILVRAGAVRTPELVAILRAE